jgi:hypothetical protein
MQPAQGTIGCVEIGAWSDLRLDDECYNNVFSDFIEFY